jgi:hypothetical protein
LPPVRKRPLKRVGEAWGRSDEGGAKGGQRNWGNGDSESQWLRVDVRVRPKTGEKTGPYT